MGLLQSLKSYLSNLKTLTTMLSVISYAQLPGRFTSHYVFPMRSACYRFSAYETFNCVHNQEYYCSIKSKDVDSIQICLQLQLSLLLYPGISVPGYKQFCHRVWGQWDFARAVLWYALLAIASFTNSSSRFKINTKIKYLNLSSLINTVRSSTENCIFFFGFWTEERINWFCSVIYENVSSLWKTLACIRFYSEDQSIKRNILMPQMEY